MSTQLATERLRLRLWQLADAEKLRDLWAERDPRSLRVIDSVGRPTVDDLRTSLARQLAETALTGLALLAIEDREHGQFIGYCGLIVGQATWEEPEIAFELFRSHHGRGYATEAAKAVVTAAIRSGRERLWSTVRVWNRPSLRVLEKLQFVRARKISPDTERGDLLWLTR
jgi:RimJ/RimL family protein N-acetyltransferase